jgi:hypothetical protein
MSLSCAPSRAGHLTITACYVADLSSTDMNQNLRDDEKLNKGAAGLTALNRISKPHEQAGAVLFFLSEYATCKSSLLCQAPLPW